jgi:hypothetical protein
MLERKTDILNIDTAVMAATGLLAGRVALVTGKFERNVKASKCINCEIKS